ncbi:MAG: PhoH family protein [Halobacteriota archaeon]
MKRSTRKAKIVAEVVKPSPKEKFMKGIEDIENMRATPVPKFVPATDNQKKAVALLRKGVRILFLQGSAGTGKSMLAAWWAATLKKEKKVDKIYLVRPAVVTGKSVGLLPGTEYEKLEPYFVQTLIHLEKFMGNGFMNYCIEKEDIELKSGEYLRGRSFEDCVVLVEEAQNFTSSDLEMVVTRLGRNCTFIFTGDQKQNDLKGASGLTGTINLINRMVDEQPEYLDNDDLDALEDLVGVVQFMPEDCVRDGLTKAFVKIYYNN